MNEAVMGLPEPRNYKEYKAAIDAYLREMERMRVLIDADQAETDRLRAETRAIIDELKSSAK